MYHASMRIVFTCAFVLATAAAVPVNGQPSGDGPADSSAASVKAPLPVIGGWAMLPSMFYTPETSLGGGLVALRFFQIPGSESTHSSRVLSSFLVTLNRQVIVQVVPELYLRGGALRAEGDLQYSRFPDTFYGVGNDVPEAAAEDFTATTFLLEADARVSLAPWLSAGSQLAFTVQEMNETLEGGLLDQGSVAGHDGGRIVLLGAQLASDTRDNTASAATGHFARLDARWSTETLGSDYGFSIYRLDLRQYVSLGRSVLAVQALGSYAPGTTPFSHLPQIGGQNMLRGFFAGRYRDKTLAAVQAEARLPFWRWFGLALFAGAGEVAPAPADLSVDGLHAAGGLGLRVMIDPEERLNVRIDYGLNSEGGGGMYITLGEAF